MNSIVKYWIIIWCLFQCRNVTAQADNNTFAVARQLYVNGFYDSAIHFAVGTILKKEPQPEPRLYRLIGYCYKQLGQPETSIKFFSAYLISRNDSSSLLPVFTSMGELYNSIPGMEDSAIAWYKKSLRLQTDETEQRMNFLSIINLYRKKKDFENALLWNGMYCKSQGNASNVDMINWGLSAYRVKKYHLSDSIFTAYQQRQPAEEYGYYWQGRSKAAIDSTMKSGLAVPVYQSLIDLAEKDSTVNISVDHQLEALMYLLRYHLQLNHDSSIEKVYLEKILLLDPNNPAVRKYMRLIKEHSKQPLNKKNNEK